MKILRIISALFIAFCLTQTGYAQEGKLVVLNLKRGYPVKGKIIEQTTKSVKIELLDGDIFECSADEVASIDDAHASSSSKNIFKEIKPVPQIYKKGDKILSFGIGSTSDLGRVSVPGYYSETTSLPFIPVSFEYILKDDLLDDKCALGVGGLCEYYSMKTKYENTSETKINFLLITARCYAHYSVIKKLDTYGGLSLGYYNVSASDSDFSASVKGSTNLYYFLGSRYYFNKKIAGMLELGSGISWLTFGVALRM